MRLANVLKRPRLWHLLVVGLVAIVGGVVIAPAVGAMRASAGSPATAASPAATPEATRTAAPEVAPTTTDATTTTTPETTTTGPDASTTTAPEAATTATTEAATSTTTPAPEGGGATTAPDGGTATTAPPPPQMLRQGMRGHEVRVLQDRLAALHYDLGERDGIFGAGTRHAVIAFQKVHGLSRDGIVGPQTRAALAHPTTPTPRQPRQGRYIEVDLDRQVLFFFEGTRVRRIIPVSSASGETYVSRDGDTAVAHTPRGQFEVQRKIDGWRESYLGMLWRPAYFTGGYAIHGSHSVPPYPASHGCIRVPIESMNRIFGELPIGLPVLVY